MKLEAGIIVGLVNTERLFSKIFLQSWVLIYLIGHLSVLKMLQCLRRDVKHFTLQCRLVLCIWLGDHSSIGTEVWTRLVCGRELQWLDLVFVRTCVKYCKWISKWTNTDHLYSNVHCFYAIQKVKKCKSFEMSLNSFINLLLICLLKKEGIFICWY